MITALQTGAGAHYFRSISFCSLCSENCHRWSFWPEPVDKGSRAWIHFVKSIFRLVKGESWVIVLEGSDPGRLFRWRLYSVSVHVWCHGTRVECSGVLTRGLVLNYSWLLPLSCLQSNPFCFSNTIFILCSVYADNSWLFRPSATVFPVFPSLYTNEYGPWCPLTPGGGGKVGGGLCWYCNYQCNYYYTERDLHRLAVIGLSNYIISGCHFSNVTSYRFVTFSVLFELIEIRSLPI